MVLTITSLMEHLVRMSVKSFVLFDAYLRSGTYCLLANYTVKMCAMVPVMCPPWVIMGIQDTSIGLLPPQNPHGLVAVGCRGFPGRDYLLDMPYCHFYFIFNLNGCRSYQEYCFCQGSLSILHQRICEGSA